MKKLALQRLSINLLGQLSRLWQQLSFKTSHHLINRSTNNENRVEQPVPFFTGEPVTEDYGLSKFERERMSRGLSVLSVLQQKSSLERLYSTKTTIS
jgi:hypothetical protein